MKRAILGLLLTAVMLASAAMVWAGPPLAGTWKSTNGDFDEGTATTRVGFGPDYLGPGAAIHAQSYAGGFFTYDWAINCPVVIAVTPIVPFAGATGIAKYMITYGSAYVTLGGEGNPWDGGDFLYTGVIDTYYEIRTIQYAGNLIKGVVSDHSLTAHIQGYQESCVTFGIGNGVLRGAKGSFVAGYPFDFTVLQSVKGANYPPFPASNCGPLSDGSGSAIGHFEDFRDLTISITGCTVAVEPATWGSVKSMYRR